MRPGRKPSRGGSRLMSTDPNRRETGRGEADVPSPGDRGREIPPPGDGQGNRTPLLLRADAAAELHFAGGLLLELLGPTLTFVHGMSDEARREAIADRRNG